MLSTLINELTCGHWTTVVFIELLVYIEVTIKLICTCSPTLVLTKGTKAHQRKVSSARRIVYTTHFIRAGLDFQDRVPVLSVMVRARVKFWSGMDGPKSFTRLNLSVPDQLFWYAYFFHPSRAKNFRSCKWGLSVYCFREPIKTLFLTPVKSRVLHLFPVPKTGRRHIINILLASFFRSVL